MDRNVRALTRRLVTVAFNPPVVRKVRSARVATAPGRAREVTELNRTLILFSEP